MNNRPEGNLVVLPEYLTRAHGMVRNYAGRDHQIIDFITRQPINPQSDLGLISGSWRFLSYNDLKEVWKVIGGIFRARKSYLSVKPDDCTMN